MAYATAAQLLARFDARTIGDLVADDGNRVSVQSLLTPHDNITAALDDASGEIDAALLQGKRYTSAELTALTGNSAAYLVRITCQIAFWLLWERRPSLDEESYEAAKDRARKALERLRRGEHVFDVDGAKEAGLPEQHTPTISTISRLNLTVEEARKGFYPARRLPE